MTREELVDLAAPAGLALLYMICGAALATLSVGVVVVPLMVWIPDDSLQQPRAALAHPLDRKRARQAEATPASAGFVLGSAVRAARAQAEPAPPGPMPSPDPAHARTAWDALSPEEQAAFLKSLGDGRRLP